MSLVSEALLRTTQQLVLVHQILRQRIDRLRAFCMYKIAHLARRETDFGLLCVKDIVVQLQRLLQSLHVTLWM